MNKLWEGSWLVWNYRGQVPDLIALFTRQSSQAHNKPGSFMQPAPGASAQSSVMDRYLPAAHKGHHFYKNFTKYSFPSLSLGWNMIFNMLHKCSWLFLVWNLRLLKIEEEKGEFVVCYHSLYVLPYVGLSQIPTHGEISRMRTS